LLVSVLLAFACGCSTPRRAPPVPPAVAATPSATVASSSVRLPLGAWGPGLQADASVWVPELEGGASFVVSAPLVPCTLDLAAQAKGNFPKTAEARRALAAKSMPFSLFLERCAPSYPDITLPPTSPAEARRNLAAVELCMVERYGLRGQWSPMLLRHVDVCAEVLGPSWRSPDTKTLSQWKPAQRELLRSAAQLPGLWRLGTLRVYAADTLTTERVLGRPRDPRIVAADVTVSLLDPKGQSSQVPLYKELDPQNVTLRCVSSELPSHATKASTAAIDCSERMSRLDARHPLRKADRQYNEGQMLLDSVRAFAIFSALQAERSSLDADEALHRAREMATLASTLVGPGFLFGPVNLGSLRQSRDRLLALTRAQCPAADHSQRRRLALLDQTLERLLPLTPASPMAAAPPQPAAVTSPSPDSTPCRER
jgi:hypothetical protein